MPPVYVHHLFWHAPLAFCAFHTYGRKNNDDTDDSVYTGIEYNRNHDAKHKIVLLWIFKNEFVKHPEFLMQGLFFRHASVSSTYPVSPSIRLYVTFFLRISILSASLRPHKASRRHRRCQQGGPPLVADMGVDMVDDMMADKKNCPTINWTWWPIWMLTSWPTCSKQSV